MRENWRPLRIFNIPWHIGHQFSLFTTLPFTEWYLYEPNKRRWGHESRPMPANARFVPFYEEGKYDFALLHVDAECADPEGNKGDIYKKLNSLIQDIPKIVINHGTPYIPERFDRYVKKIDDPAKKLELGKDICVQEMRKLIGNNTMVTNSKRAAEEWGFGTPIVHGMYGNPQEEYRDISPKEMIVSFLVSPGGWNYYYNRSAIASIKATLEDHLIKAEHPRVNVSFSSYEEYRDYIGRVLISVYPFRESPMPRSRTEHMLSGGCVVTANNHDIGDHFKGLDFKKTPDGKLLRNEYGEIIPEFDPETAELVWGDPENPDDFSQKILWLYERPSIAIKIGQNGKKRAQEVFNWNRYRSDWYKLLVEQGIL